MKVPVRFGRTGMDLELDGGWEVTILRARPMTALPDPAAAAAGVLARPVGSGTLAQEARGRSDACILICDVTRPVPNGLVLRPLIQELAAAGIPRERVRVLVATGLHRPNLGAELAEVVGDPWVLENVRVENHDARSDAGHASLGRTSRGIPVLLDRRFLETGVRIVVGLVEPHFMAGYSGGRKLIAPGVAHASTIRGLHAARLLSHPCSASCVLDGNPVHAAQEEILALAGPALAVSFVIDDARRPCFVSFGGIRESHRAAVDYLERHCRVPVAEPFSTVVTSSAGYPLDATFYQTVKAMVGAAPILAPGGRLLTVSECAEGLGSADFRASQARLAAKGRQAFAEEAARREAADIDEWETVMLLKALEAGDIALYAPGLPPEDRGIAGVRVIQSVAEEMGALLEKSPDRRLAVIPEGPYVAPYVPGREAGAG
jgi:lactate racemase